MSAVAAIPGKVDSSVRFWQAPIGKKAVMAVTGVVLFLFVVGHLAGNLQIYLGAERINAYGALLHHNLALLWAVRLVLLTIVALHVTAAIQLWLLNKKARPIGYVRKDDPGTTYASRTMMWSGPIIGAFVVFHLLHFTLGTVHPDFREEAGIPLVYQNVVAGFEVWYVSLFYIVAMGLLGIHLYHGMWSLFQSLGIAHPRYTLWFKKFAAAAAVILAGGNISIPLAVLAGIIRPL